MLSTLHRKLFGPPTPLPPRCPGTGSEHISARRAATDARYTARPLDHFPNPLIPPEELRRVRAEAGVLDEMFAKYKREAACEIGPGEGRISRLRRCEECDCWCCNACRFHTSYRLVSSSPLLFSDEVHVPPGCADHARLVPNKQMQTLHIRLRDHEHPYELALMQQYAQRWHGYCHDCLPRVSAALIRQLDGHYERCRCERSDAAKQYRRRWICTGCFEEECADIIGKTFEESKCKGRGCKATIAEVGWDRFQPVCKWCWGIIDSKGIEAAKEALREAEGFEVLRKDSRKD